MSEDPFAPFHRDAFHRDAAPTDEPLPEVPDEPDGFEAHLFNRLGTFGVLKAMAGDTSSVVGVLTVGRDWCRWDPPGGREATHIELAHIEHEMILARAGGRAPEALNALRANRPPELDG